MACCVNVWELRNTVLPSSYTRISEKLTGHEMYTYTVHGLAHTNIFFHYVSQWLTMYDGAAIINRRSRPFAFAGFTNTQFVSVQHWRTRQLFLIRLQLRHWDSEAAFVFVTTCTNLGRLILPRISHSFSIFIFVKSKWKIMHKNNAIILQLQLLVILRQIERNYVSWIIFYRVTVAIIAGWNRSHWIA